MKTRKKDIKLALSTAGLVVKIRKQMPPVGKPILDKKRQSNVDLVGRKAKYRRNLAD